MNAKRRETDEQRNRRECYELLEDIKDEKKETKCEGVIKTAEIQNDYDTSKQAYQSIENLVDYKIVGEIFKEFIILEKDDNMLLLDFHAGHERLNYDKFVKMVENKDIAIQDYFPSLYLPCCILE